MLQDESADDDSGVQSKAWLKCEAQYDGCEGEEDEHRYYRRLSGLLKLLQA